MKVLLLRPFVDSTIGISPPLSIMYLSSFLKSKQLEVELIDNYIDRRMIGNLRLGNKHIERLFGKIRDFGPDIIGMTLFSRELSDMAILCKLIKKEFNSAYIVLGGPHPTAMPNETMTEIPECDFVVRGEAEIILYNLIIGILNGTALHSIKGISFRNNSNIFHTDDGDVIANLDSLPFPDRASLEKGYSTNKYGSFLYGFPSDTLITSRGCPYQCYFCFKICRKYRSRSPHNVIEEVEWIINNISPRSIQIVDDSFTIEKDRCSVILEHLISRKYTCEFKIRSRVDAVDKELLKKMKEAGVSTIVYGFESGSQRMLDTFDKRITVEQSVKICKLTKETRMDCFGDMILFYPGENRVTLRDTERFIKTAVPTGIKFYILSPLPGTKVYSEAKERGSLIGDWGVGKETPWIKLEEFKNLAEMEMISKKMFLKMMLNVRRIFWILKIIATNFFRNPYQCFKLVFYCISKNQKY